MHYKQQQSPFPTHQESCSWFRYADHAQKASVDLAIENFVSLNSPVGSASKSYHHCSRVQQPMEHKCLHPHWPVGRQLGMYLFASSYWHWKCPGGNVIFLWKWNVLCFAYFSSLSLMRVIKASSETLLLMQQGACVTCQKLNGMREWVHNTTCASFIPNSIRLFSLLRTFGAFLTIGFFMLELFAGFFSLWWLYILGKMFRKAS